MWFNFVLENFFHDSLSSNLITPSGNLVSEKMNVKGDEKMQKKMTPDTVEDYKKSTD